MFYLFTDGNVRRDTRALERAGLNVQVIQFRVPIPWLTLWSSKAIGYFSPLVLSKFEIFKILSKHPRVIWLDYDIVIQKPLDSLLAENDHDLAYMDSGHKVRDAFLIAPLGYDMELPGMSAGIISGRNSALQDENHSKYRYGLFQTHAASLVLPEQAIFDIFFQTLSFERRTLRPEIYAVYPDTAESDNAVILHCWGPRKFWNGLDNRLWNQYQEQWRRLGGSRYSPARSAVKRLSRKARFGLATIIITISTFLNSWKRLRFGHSAE
jgi:lipopolysaccharide biosynthesis glycosyltransferase